MGIETALIAGAAVGGLAAMSSRGRSANTTTQTTNTTPWQSAQLNAGFNNARGIFDDYSTQQPYWGDTSADWNQWQRRGVNNMIARAGADQPGINRATRAADALIGQTDDFTRNAGVLARNGAAPENTLATGVLSNAARGQLNAPSAVTNNGVNAMQAGAGTAASLVQRANGDPAQRALTAGGSFADSDVIQAQIDNAALDVRRNMSETVLPGLNAQASAGGNLNSARAGIAEAMARRDAGESVGRIAAEMRGNAFNTGVQASLEGNAQNNTLALGANQQRIGAGNAIAGVGENVRQFNVDTRVNSAEALAGVDTANRALDANVRLEANDQIGRGALAGFDARGAAMDMADQASGRYLTAGGVIQAEEQRAMDEAQELFYRNYNYRQGILGDFLGHVNGNWGGSSTATSVAPSPNIFQGILGGATMGLGMYNSTRRPSVGAGYTGNRG